MPIINCPNPVCDQMLILLTGRAPGWVECNFCGALIELQLNGERPPDAERIDAEMRRKELEKTNTKETEECVAGSTRWT